MSDSVGPIARIGLTAAGAYFGGPIGAYIGSTVGGLLFPAGQDVQGPRLDDLRMQTSAIGAPVPIVYGTYPVTGNVFWATELREESSSQSAGKGGGPEQTTYSYYATFAVGLCEGPIVGVRRIWANQELVYDARPKSDAESADEYAERAAATASFGEYVTVYYGTEVQDPDPTIEAEEGAGTVPGFRGLAYLLFADLPVDRYGSRIPALQVEVVTAGSTEPAEEEYSNEVLYPWIKEAVIDVENCRNDHEYSAIDAKEWGSKEDAIQNTVDDEISGVDSSNFQFLLGWSLDGQELSRVYLPNAGEKEELFLHHNRFGSHNLKAFYGSLSWTNIDSSCDAFYTNDLPADGERFWWSYELEGEESTSVLNGSWRVTPGADYNGDGDIVFGSCTEYPFEGGFYPVISYSPDGELFVRRVPRAPDNPCDPRCDDPLPLIDGGRFCVIADSLFANTGWARDESRTYKVLARYAAQGGEVVRYPLNPARPEGHSAYDDQAFWESAYAAAVEAGDLPPGMSYRADGDGDIDTYPRIQSFGYTRTPYADPLAAESVPLSDIVSDLCDRANLAHYDVSDLESVEVHGFAVGRVMSARDAIRPLRQYGLFDGGEIDGELVFVRRGGGSVATLTANDLGAYESGTTRPPSVRVERTQDVELPRRLRVRYRSVNRDYEESEQAAGRLTTDAVQVQDVEVVVAMTDDEAAQLAEILLYEAWTGRNVYRTALAIPQLALSPTDPITLPVDGVQERARIINSDYRVPGIIDVELVRDDDGAYVSYAVGETGGIRYPTLGVAGPTEAVLMNLPALTDDDDRPGYFVAMRGLLPRWGGAVLLRSADGGASYTTVATSNQAATMGSATNALGDSLTTVWDRGNTLNVALDNGELEGITEDAVIAGGNVAALEVRDGSGNTIGWEVLQFADATQQGDGSWDLTDLLRGRRGTEWAVDQHQAGDRFVLLTGGGIARVALDLSGVGEERRHKPVTTGQDAQGAEELQFAGQGVALRPYAPVHIGAREVSGDLYLHWIRRTRLGGEWQDGMDVPLSELDERYEVDIVVGGAVVRTLPAMTTEVLYDSSALIADFGIVPEQIVCRVCQISDAVGRGYVAEATVDIPASVAASSGGGDDDDVVQPSTDSAQVDFTGTFHTSDSFDITVVRSGARARLTVDATGHAALSDLADDFASQVAAEFPDLAVTRPVPTAVKMTVTTGTIFVVHDRNSVLHSTLSMARMKQVPMPVTVGVRQQVSIDLYRVQSGILTESPEFGAEYRRTGSGRVRLPFYGLTYAAEKAQGGLEVEKGLSWSTPEAPSTEYTYAISGLVAAVNESDAFADYGLQGQGLQQGPAEARPKARLRVDSNYRIQPDIFSTTTETGNSHPSGHEPFIAEVVAGVPDLPSGAKQLVVVRFSASASPTDPLQSGMRFTVTLDGVDYTADIGPGDITSALYFSDAYDALKTLIEASGDYDVTLITGTNSSVSPTQYTQGIEIERNVVNTPFTYDAYASYGARVRVTIN